MTHATSIKTLALSLIVLTTMSACVIVDDTDTRQPRRTGTTTTTTTTTTVDNGPVVPDFVPVMGAVSAEMIDRDVAYGTSWQVYHFNFTDVADSYACTQQMATESTGTVATVNLVGYEMQDEFAACPVGTYDVVPDCELFEGEACVEILYRDTEGWEAGRDFASYGVVDVFVEPAYEYGVPHRCIVSTSVDGDPDMSFSYELLFDSFDLSPQDHHEDTICTM